MVPPKQEDNSVIIRALKIRCKIKIDFDEVQYRLIRALSCMGNCVQKWSFLYVEMMMESTLILSHDSVFYPSAPLAMTVS